MTAADSLAARDLVRVHVMAARFFRDQLAGSWVPGYLTSRGLGPDAQRRWNAGYAPARRDGLTAHLRAAGYQDLLIEAAGLARRNRQGQLTDSFRDRAVLPIRSAAGTIIAFIGRAPEHAHPAVARYLNSPATALYNKGQILFGLHEARGALAAGAVPVIVEGPLDVIAIATASGGAHAPVAPCGTALTADQVDALSHAADLHRTGVLVAFDADDAGRRAAIKAYHLLSGHGHPISAVTFPDGLDPAHVLREHGPAALNATLTNRTRPLADLVIDAEISQWEKMLRFAEGQIGALRAAAPRIAAMPPPDVGRQVARLARRLGLDHSMVTEAVTDALTALAGGGPAGARPFSSHDPPGRPTTSLSQERRSAAVNLCGPNSPPSATYEPVAYLARRASKPLSPSRRPRHG